MDGRHLGAVLIHPAWNKKKTPSVSTPNATQRDAMLVYANRVALQSFAQSITKSGFEDQRSNHYLVRVQRHSCCDTVWAVHYEARKSD
jgi:hypothetical protein